MASDSTQKPGENDGFSAVNSGLPHELKKPVFTPSFSQGSKPGVGVGRGISAFFESLPELEAELAKFKDDPGDARKDGSENTSETGVFDANSQIGFSIPLTASTGTSESSPRGAVSDPSFGTSFGGASFGSSKTRFSHRSKSSLRMRYDAEVLLIKRKIGDLEFIRETLGLSQRKVCQLLMVDPSAWTRWTKKGEDAPPHIYRALLWYLAIQEKYPALDVNFWLSTVAKTDEAGVRRHEEKISALGDEFADLTSEIKRLQEELKARTAEFSRRMSDVQEKMHETEMRSHQVRTSTHAKNRWVFAGALLGALALGFLLAAVLLK